jgi:YVTN family beta-propeller protein
MKAIPILRALALVLTLTSTALHAQVPQIINYQGRVAVGSPAVNFDGSGAFKFALVNTDGTTTYWSNDGTSTTGSEPTAAVTLPVTKGLYSVLLGANMTAIPATVFANPDVRLRVWFNDGTNGSQLLTPDQRITAAGYAMVAGTLQPGATISGSLGIGSSPNSKLHVNVGPAEGIQGLRVQVDGNSKFTVASNGGTSIGFFNETPPADGLYVQGNVGLGVINPSAKLDVAGTIKATAFSGDGSGLTGIVASSTSVNLQQIALLKWGVNSAVNTFSVGNNPQSICFDGANIWVTNGGSNTVTKLNAGTGATIGTYSVGAVPFRICSDGASIWVAHNGSATVIKLNASTGATIGTYNVATRSQGICFDGANIWVTNFDSTTVTKLNAGTGATIGTYSVGTRPQSICFDGTSIWVVNLGDFDFGDNPSVTKLNASTGATIGTYGAGQYPSGICFDGVSIWVVDQGNGNVMKLNPSTGASLGTYGVGSAPGGICFDGSSIWVVNAGGNNVTKL